MSYLCKSEGHPAVMYSRRKFADYCWIIWQKHRNNIKVGLQYWNDPNLFEDALPKPFFVYLEPVLGENITSDQRNCVKTLGFEKKCTISVIYVAVYDHKECFVTPNYTFPSGIPVVVTAMNKIDTFLKNGTVKKDYLDVKRNESIQYFNWTHNMMHQSSITFSGANETYELHFIFTYVHSKLFPNGNVVQCHTMVFFAPSFSVPTCDTSGLPEKWKMPLAGAGVAVGILVIALAATATYYRTKVKLLNRHKNLNMRSDKIEEEEDSNDRYSTNPLQRGKKGTQILNESRESNIYEDPKITLGGSPMPPTLPTSPRPDRNCNTLKIPPPPSSTLISNASSQRTFPRKNNPTEDKEDDTYEPPPIHELLSSTRPDRNCNTLKIPPPPSSTLISNASSQRTFPRKNNPTASPRPDRNCNTLKIPPSPSSTLISNASSQRTFPRKNNPTDKDTLTKIAMANRPPLPLPQDEFYNEDKEDDTYEPPPIHELLSQTPVTKRREKQQKMAKPIPEKILRPRPEKSEKPTPDKLGKKLLHIPMDGLKPPGMNGPPKHHGVSLPQRNNVVQVPVRQIPDPSSLKKAPPVKPKPPVALPKTVPVPYIEPEGYHNDRHDSTDDEEWTYEPLPSFHIYSS